MRQLIRSLACLMIAGTVSISVSAAEPVRRLFSSLSGTMMLRVSTDENGTAITGTMIQTGAGLRENRVIWNKSLAFLPEKAFVSDAGEVILVQKIVLDQNTYWQAREVPNAVSAYSAMGELLAQYELTDFTEHQKLWDRISGAPNRSAKVFSDSKSWTASCRFEIDERYGQLLITPESGRTRRIDFTTGGKTFLPPGMQLQAPRLQVVGITRGDRSRLLIDMINPNDHALSYYGYTRDSFSPEIPAGWIYPLYQIERVVDDQREPINVGFCKTGQVKPCSPQ